MLHVVGEVAPEQSTQKMPQGACIAAEASSAVELRLSKDLFDQRELLIGKLEASGHRGVPW